MSPRHLASLALALTTVAGLAACASSNSRQAAKIEPAAHTATLANVPATRVETVTDVYHGTKVADPYRWLEDWNSTEVQAWSDAQNATARAVLDNLPNLDAIRTRATQLLSAEVPSYGSFEFRDGTLFALKRQPPNQQPLLIATTLDGSSERVVLDLNASDPTHSTTIDWYIPSHSGKLIAVSLSSGGSEMGDVHILDAATGKEVGETITRVQGGTAGGYLAWESDDSGFYYTRYPREGERASEDLNFYVQVYHHTLGTDPATDRYEIGKDFPRIAEIMLETTKDPRGREWVLASVQNGDGGEFMHFLKTPGDQATGKDGQWKQLTQYDDRVVQAALGDDGYAYWISRKDAPRGKLLRSSLDEARMNGFKTLIDESKDTIADDFFEPSVMRITPGYIYLTYQTGGPSEMRVFDKDGNKVVGPDLFPVSTVGGMTPLTNNDVLFANASYLEPQTWKVFMPPPPRTKMMPRTEATRFSTRYDFVDTSNYEVRREFATSKDGTKVPVNIVCKKGVALDGSNPTLLTAYGGYGVSITPYFSLRDVLLLEQGFVLAEANIRGGGEYGEEWHLQGNLTKKQNVFDDFLACAQHLIKRNYTNTNRLAIEGGSNGGLLMGAAMTQRPELFKCVVSHVGIYDMLRVELSPNGAFNITEFGTVKNKDQFKALYAYSPYHRVKPGVSYPPVLFLTGANDPRVDPMQSRKMTAMLQSTNNYALLRTSANTGHGAGTPLNARIEQTVDVAAWLFDQLGVEYK